MTSILPTKRYDRYTSEAPPSFGEADLDFGPPSTERHDDVLASAENAMRLSYRPPVFSLSPAGKYAFSLPPTARHASVEPEPVSLSDADVFVMPNIPLAPRALQLTFPPTIPAPAVDDVDDIEVVSSRDLVTSGLTAKGSATPTSGAVPSSATRPSAKFEIAPAASMPDSGSLSAIEVLSKPASSPRRPSVSLLAQVSAPAPSRTNHLAFGLVGVAVCALAGALFVHRAAQSAHLERNAHVVAAAVVVNAAPPSVEEPPFGPPTAPVHVPAAAPAPSARHAVPAQPASAQPARSAEVTSAHEAGAAPTDLDGMLAAANAVRAHGDVRGARDRYVAIHKGSPRFLPAALGVADTTWDLGETDAARKAYAELATSYPQRLLPARVVERSGVSIVTDAPRN